MNLCNENRRKKNKFTKLLSKRNEYGDGVRLSSYDFSKCTIVEATACNFKVFWLTYEKFINHHVLVLIKRYQTANNI